jgi:cytoskeletal protein CcmA (bactofilin family)
MIRRKSTPERPPLAAIMGADAHYEGDLRFDGRVRVDGHFSGRIYSEDLLEVGRDGIIEGEADVCRAVVAGEIRGRIRVREHLLLESTAKVNAVMDVGVLEVLPGAQIRGELRVRGEEES